MQDNDAQELRDAWPDLPQGLRLILPDKWQEVADAPVIEGENHPWNAFTMPLANLAYKAGFDKDLQGKEFIAAAMDAAGVPADVRDQVRLTFLVQLHIHS